MQIEQALKALDPASFQRLGDAYLHRLGYDRLNPLGLVLGANKVTQGTPDTLVSRDDGTFDFIEYTTQQSGLCAKLTGDIEKCFDEGKTGIPVNRIHEIVLCHNSSLSPEEECRLVDTVGARSVKLRTIGLGILAHDLYQKYPHLAKDFLEIEIDTGQILDPEDFVAIHDRAARTTPLNTAFHFRDDEMAQALGRLKAGKVVLVSGRPGAGKSRLALECCRRYADHHPGVRVLCVFNRGLNLYEDIRRHLSDPGEYLILVDDANRITRFEYVLQLLQETRTDRKYTIVATVRDYALAQLVDLAQPYGASVVELERLKDEQIRELVRHEFGVQNASYLERIANIAQGNPRLAVMAAKVAVKANTLESIANVLALYDEYYRSIRQDLQGMGDTHLLKAAAIIAFFRVVDRSNAEQMEIIDQVFGMASDEFWSYTRQLHDLEAVDIYENEVVKVSDQVLATYLFYLAALREGYIDLTSMFKHLFPKFRKRFVEALDPVFTAFGGEAINAIRPHVDAAWDLLLQRGNDDILHLMDLFGFIRPAETLVRVAEMISRMPGEPTLEAGLEFKKSQGGVPAPSALSILGRFAYGDDASVRVALQSLVDYFIHRPSEVGLVLRVLEESFGITHHSPLSGFAVQQMVVDVLSDRAKGGEEELVARLFMTYAQSLLHTHFDRTEPIRGHAFTILKFDVLPTDELKELRRRTWRCVLGYYQVGRLRDQVLQFIEEHCRSGYYVASPELVSSDAQEVVPFFVRELNPSEYRDCVVVHEYLGLLRLMNVPFNGELAARFTNETFELATLLLDNWVKHRNGDWQEFERQKEERLNEFGKRLRKDDINPIVERCREIRDHLTDNSHEAYVFENGLRQVLLAMAKQNPKLFVGTVVEHLQQGNTLGLTPWVLVENLIRIAGPDEAYRLLNENEYPHKARWLSEYFIALPPEAATQERLGQMYDLYDKTPANQLAYDLGFLLKFTSIDPDIILKVTRLLLTKADAEPAARERLTGVVSGRTKIGRSAAALFREDVPLLKQIYFAATSGAQENADYDGQVFDALLSMDAGFIAEWVAWMFSRKDWLTHHDDHRDYTFLWRREDYREILERLLEAIVQEGRKHYGAGSYPLVFFTIRGGAHDHEALRVRQDAFLGELISNRSNDQALMGIVFDLVGEFDPERRLPLIATFLEHNQDVEAFEHLSLQPEIRGWAGSAVAVWQKDIDFLESLLPLCDSVPLLRHRQVIEKRIRSLQNEIEMEKKRDFLRE